MSWRLHRGKQAPMKPWATVSFIVMGAHSELIRIIAGSCEHFIICHQLTVSSHSQPWGLSMVWVVAGGEAYGAPLFFKKSVEMCIRFMRFHDTMIKWKQLLRHWSFVRGIHLSLVDSPHKGPVTRALMLVWTNSRVTSDLKHQDAYCDVTVMLHDLFLYSEYRWFIIRLW